MKEDQACVTARKHAQQHEQSGRLREARDSLLSCARATCGAFVQQDCASRYAQLNGDIPTVIPLVTDDGGAPRVDVEVRLDGQVLASTLDGRALAVDPGLHELSFSIDDKVFETQRVMIVQGQRNRVVSVLFRDGKRHPKKNGGALASNPPPAPAADPPASASDDAAEAPALKPAPAPIAALVQAKDQAKDDDGDSDDGEHRPRAAAGKTARPSHARGADLEADAKPASSGGHSTAALVVGGLGLATAGAGALLVYWGRGDNDMLGQCTPNCPKASVDHIKRLYLAGDIALGAGAAALVAAVWIYAVSGDKEPEGREAHGLQALRLDVRPSAAGAVAGLTGRF